MIQVLDTNSRMIQVQDTNSRMILSKTQILK